MTPQDASIKDRCEKRLAEAFRAIRFSDEILRIVKEGRVPWNIALAGLEMQIEVCETKIAEESLARDEEPTPVEIEPAWPHSA
jgi:hypothetical protein